MAQQGVFGIQEPIHILMWQLPRRICRARPSQASISQLDFPQVISSDAVYTEIVRPRSLSVIVIGDHAYAVRGYLSGPIKGKIAETNLQNTQAVPVLQKRSK